jgi:SAM-dependent methyltransferase
MLETIQKKETNDVLSDFYPEIGAGGFTRVDGTINFFTRVNSLLKPHMTVVDFGAGRGKFANDNLTFRRNLCTLKGKVKKVIGVDIDPVVLDNSLVDESLLIAKDQPWPIPDGSIDLIISHSTFEHIDNPDFVSEELCRILKPNGWICASTPNRWGYVGFFTNLIPNSLHVKFLRFFQPSRKDIDVFPTCYLMNTTGRIRKIFSSGKFDNYTYTYNGGPGYSGNKKFLIALLLIFFRIIPPILNTKLFVFLRKRS